MIAKLNKKRRGDGSARRWVAEKPGFLRSFWVKVKDCGKNPVSELWLRGLENVTSCNV